MDKIKDPHISGIMYRFWTCVSSTLLIKDCVESNLRVITKLVTYVLSFSI